MFGFLQSSCDYRGYIEALDRLVPILTASAVMPTYLRSLFLTCGALVPQVFKALRSFRHIETAAEACVMERQRLLADGASAKKNDILGALFDIIREKGEKVDFGIEEVKVEIYTAL